MYYRVAMRKNVSSPWHWHSTIISSLQALVQFLRPYGALAQDRLRVFSAHSRAEMPDLLARENNGQPSNSALAAQFLQEHGFHHHPLCVPATVPPTRPRQSGPARTTTHLYENAPVSASTLLQTWSAYTLERSRDEVERGAGGDHDLPYTFSLPSSAPQALAWMSLLARVQRGELQS